MTNNEIILQAVSTAFTPEQIAALVAACYTPEQIAARRACVVLPEGCEASADDMIAADMAADTFHTFAEWKRLGYSVKKGEHAALVCHLWRFTDRPTKAQREAAEAAGENPEESGGGDHFYKAKSHLFSRLQVEKRGE